MQGQGVLTQISERRLNELLDSFQHMTIAVIGDVMLDRYFWGSVNRISPEAPVPIVDVESESARLGGAANVAHNIKTLGGTPFLISVIGNDSSGDLLFQTMEEQGFPLDGFLRDGKRPTTVKTRIIAHNQHVVRIDREVRDPINENLVGQLSRNLATAMDRVDAIILEDYNKGIVTPSLVKNVVADARKHKKIVTVDPKFTNFFEYQGVTLFKPNKREVELAFNRRLTNEIDITNVGRELINRMSAENVLITRGEHGMSLFESSGEETYVPANARTVADVSGAGDTVISTLTMALASGATPKEACTLANFAGGVVCGQVGVVPISQNALRQAVVESINHTPPQRRVD
jgi:rfaE bifunctional protein kinase chain/domain